ncbi:hypothetical protein QCA50_019748 [Cerrena zonata]|uniref:Uncharacterized protein n=1 Tax=Cerrena zonata TaxID=2478898 RepID=A0AAW0FJ73_9APHY
MTLSITDFDTKSDGEWHAVLQHLAISTKKYESLSKRNTSEKERTSLEILSLLRRASETHPDEHVRDAFRREADAWERGDRKTKKDLRPLKLFLQGIGLVVIMPFLMAGALLHGTGKIISSMGNVMALGQLNKFVKGTILE